MTRKKPNPTKTKPPQQTRQARLYPVITKVEKVTRKNIGADRVYREWPKSSSNSIQVVVVFYQGLPSEGKAFQGSSVFTVD